MKFNLFGLDCREWRVNAANASNDAGPCCSIGPPLARFPAGKKILQTFLFLDIG
jgi:hypothetical protein